jgi:hypothetical protein
MKLEMDTTENIPNISSSNIVQTAFTRMAQKAAKRKGVMSGRMDAQESSNS